MSKKSVRGVFVCCLLGILALTLATTSALATDRGARFQNLDRIIEALNLRPYFAAGQQPARHLKIAIFDNGFRGAAEEIGYSLPDNTQIHAGPTTPPGEEEDHGFYMARIFYDLVTLGGKNLRYAPAEFHLYNTYGYSNLKAAVDDVIDRDMDIVLYSQTWEYGGNFDGKGFLNALVSRVVETGTIWVNNAGNFGLTTFNSKVQNVADDWVKLPGRNSSVEVRCEDNPLHKCQLRAVLSWNDFSDDVEVGTNKDLDLVLTDDTLNVLQSSALTQKVSPQEGAPGVSKYPREILTAEVKPGLYLLRVKNRSNNFVARDRLRIAVSGEFLTMAPHDPEESVLPPADHPGVLTVGALDSNRTSLSYLLEKPDLWTESLVSLSAENNFKGSSNSAAMVAAGVTILYSLDYYMTPAELLAKSTTPLRSSSSTRHSETDETAGQGAWLDTLGFYPTNEAKDCFQPVDTKGARLPAHVQRILNLGGILVETTKGPRIFFPRDPLPQLAPGFVRRLPNDLLAITALGPLLYPRTLMETLPSGAFEVVQTPWAQKICSLGTDFPDLPPFGKRFRLQNPPSHARLRNTLAGKVDLPQQTSVSFDE